jgi:tRNA G18 (ribose-2'-O)-methylase SpoU
MALVLGNEAKGVSAEALELCDACVDLAMLGEKASINVGNAAAAALYAILARYRQQLDI